MKWFLLWKLLRFLCGLLSEFLAQRLISHSPAKSTCARSRLITASPGRDPSFTAGSPFAKSGTTCAMGLPRSVIVSALPVRCTFLISAMQCALNSEINISFMDLKILDQVDMVNSGAELRVSDAQVRILARRGEERFLDNGLGRPAAGQRGRFGAMAARAPGGNARWSTKGSCHRSALRTAGKSFRSSGGRESLHAGHRVCRDRAVQDGRRRVAEDCQSWLGNALRIASATRAWHECPEAPSCLNNRDSATVRPHGPSSKAPPCQEAWVAASPGTRHLTPRAPA